MKHRKKIKIATLFFIMAICFCMTIPYTATEETIYIKTAQDLVDLSKNCGLDSWSIGKKIELNNDISLKDIEFEPIPYFAGTFEGNGYTISDVEITENVYPAGIFGITKSGAIISNLHITGSIMPEGEKNDVGGIVGINGGILRNCSFSGVVSGENSVGGIVGRNKETGNIENCNMQGHVFGKFATGGIIGRNLGNVLDCENEAYVNNTSADTTIQLEDLNTNLLQNLYAVNTSDVTNAATDNGGIAGYSSGTVQNCRNRGTIGYPHVGYNTGGIVGRNGGYVKKCENNGLIYGRKDVGGIVGQAEPFIDLEISVSGLSVLEGQLASLKQQVDNTTAGLENTGNQVFQSMNKISNYLTQAGNALDKLKEMSSFENIELPNSNLSDNFGSLGDIELPDNNLSDNLGSLGNGNQSENLGSLEDLWENSDISESINDLQKDWNSAKDLASELADCVNDVAEELEKIGTYAESGTEEFSSDMKVINEQANGIYSTLAGIADDTKNASTEDVIADTSEISVESVTFGKIADCVNQESVQGDLNVGGIVGTMSVEYEVDPEDDLTIDISAEVQKKYEVKSIVSRCTNRGIVIAKKDNVGAICGLMNIGLITNCQAFGSVESQSGDYAGGIAGIARSTIANSIANIELSGNHYVGGIVGSGYTFENGGSIVKNCYSLVKITDCKQFKGAISGYEAGNFKNNYFVSNDLEGINRISYQGKAEPISYEQLLQVQGLPEELKGFTLRFVADEKVIEAIDFSFGDSFGEEVFPEVPKKDGYDGTWDTTDLTNLCFDTVVTAEYTKYVTSLQSEDVRKNNRPILFVEGNFNGTDSITLTEVELTQEKQSELQIAGNVLELWNITFNDDGQKRHMIRFLPEEDMNNTKLYIKENDEWNKVETTEIGSYVCFQAVGNTIEIAVVSGGLGVAVFIGTIVVVLAIFMLFIFLEKKNHILSNFFRKIKKKFGLKKIVLLLVLLGIIGGVAIAIYFSMMPKVRMSAELASISSDILTAKNQSMKLHLIADVGSNHIELDSNVYLKKENETSIFVLEENGHSIYFNGHSIYLENGKGFQIEQVEDGNTDLFNQILKLFEITEITKTQEQDKTIYSITTSGEDAQNVLAILVPSTEGQLASAGDTEIHLTASDGILQSVEIKGSASLKDAMETAIEVSATISDFSEQKAKEYQIPEKVSQAIQNAESASFPIMGEEMYRLLLAWTEFYGKDHEGSVALDIECGLINFETKLDWADIEKGIADISNIVDNFNNSSNSGNNTSNGSSNINDIKHIPDIIYEVCLNGEFSCYKFGNSYEFTLALNEETIAKIVELIAPEIKTQAVNLTNGELEVIVEQNEIASFKITIDGKIDVVLSEVDASVCAEFVFE